MKAHARAAMLLLLTPMMALAGALPAHAAPAPKVAGFIVDATPFGDLHAGDTSNLTIELWNDGDEVATGVSATLSSSNAGIDVVDPGPKPYSDIEVNNQATPAGHADPFIVVAADDAPCGPADFTLDVSTDQGDFAVPLEIPISGACAQEPSALIAWGTVAMRDASTGETVEDLTIGRATILELTLRNDGDLDADSITGSLSAPESDADITNGEADFGPIPSSGEAIGTFGLTLTECDPVGLLVHLAVEGAPVVDSSGVTTPPPAGTLALVLDTRCPGMHLLFKGAEFDDAAGGNGDGVPQPGETVSVFIRVENDGADTLSGMIGTFQAEHADVLEASAPFPDVSPKQEVTNSAPFVIRVHDDAPTFTVSDDTRCAYFLWGGPPESLPPGTQIANFKQTVQIENADGETEVGVSAFGGVCSIATTGPGGDPLAETGASPFGTAALGGSLLLLGCIIRRYATRTA